jgi:hypothetical protein
MAGGGIYTGKWVYQLGLGETTMADVKITDLPDGGVHRTGDTAPVVRGIDTVRAIVVRQFDIDGPTGPHTTTVEADVYPSPTNWVTARSAPFAPAAVGTYQIDIQGIWSLTTITKSALFRFGVDGVYSDALRVEPKSVDNSVVVAWHIYEAFTDTAVKTVEVQYLITSGPGTDTLTLDKLTVTAEYKRV